MNLEKIAEIIHERRPIEALNPAEYNPRKDLQPGDEEYEKIKNSIKTFGYVDPIIINHDGTVIGGHQRLKVLKEMGYNEVDCSVVNLSKKDEKALNLALNKIEGEWDEEKLAAVFEELKEEDYDFSATGFDLNEINGLLLDFEENKIDLEKADEDVPLPSVEPISCYGDVWILGDHRVICGDSQDKSTYDTLMEGEKANLLITDPPYNVDYEGSAGKIINDNMTENAFKQFLANAFKEMAEAIENGAAAYIFYGDAFSEVFRNEFRNAGFLLKQCLIWVKNTFVLGRQDYQWRHEPILYGWKQGAAHYFADKRNLSTVVDGSGRPEIESMSREEMADLLEFIYDELEMVDTTILYSDKPVRNLDHPTMKPVKLIHKLIENSSQAGWIVLDPFGGSGSTLIAAEAAGRKARLIELDPKFCDVIVKRYVKTTEKTNVRLVRDGKEIPIKETGILDED